MKGQTGTTVLACAILVFGCAFGAGGQPDTRVVINGTELKSDVIIVDDRVYVPLRACFETAGGQVLWDDATRTAQVTLPVEADLPDMIEKVSQSVVAIAGNRRNENGTVSLVGGTGVIIKPNGEILTNAHVVQNVEQIIVVMNDGSGYEAALKYFDAQADLAVIKIEKLGLPAIAFAEMDGIEVGQTVVAIGTPVSFSLRNSAAKGIISGIDCNTHGNYRMLQTDAAINPGNSGGPLVNEKGELVGINTSGLKSAQIDGINFAIPVDTVQYAISQFEQYGKIFHPRTGIVLTESWVSKIGFPTMEGLSVSNVMADSAGQRAGIAAGDVLTAIGECATHSLVDVNEAYKCFAVGQDMPFHITRNGQSLILSVKAEE